MTIVRALLVLLNSVCGIIFVLMALLKFNFHWGSFIILFFSIVLIVRGYEVERQKLSGFFSNFDKLKRDYFLLFVINTIAFLILCTSASLHIQVQFLIYWTGGLGNFYVDFYVLGLEIKRNIKSKSIEPKN